MGVWHVQCVEYGVLCSVVWCDVWCDVVGGCYKICSMLRAGGFHNRVGMGTG